MLTVKNYNLTKDNFIITSYDTVLTLISDIDGIIFGDLKLQNDISKTFEFSKINNVYKARLVLYNEDFNYLQESKLSLIYVSELGEKVTTSVELSFDETKIALSEVSAKSKEYKEITKRITLLEKKLDDISTNKTIQNINIVNKDSVSPGMVLVALNAKGDYIASQPFKDFLTSVNGQQAISGDVIIDSSMIQYNKEIILKDYIEMQSASIKALKELCNSLASTLAEVNNKLTELNIKIETHTSSGII